METTTTTTPDAATPQRNWLEIKERGLKFSRFSTPTQRRLIAKGGGPREQHIYEISVLHLGEVMGLSAVLSRDGKEFARVYCVDKSLGIGRLEKMAVAAFKAFLHAGAHRSRDAFKRRKREAEAAQAPQDTPADPQFNGEGGAE